MSVTVLLTPMSARVCGSAPSYSGGYVIAPTPMMTPWPGMRRGTECSVPIVPGFVSDTVVRAKSSTVSLLVRARRMRSSYAAWKPAKSNVSAFLMFGTSRVRLPSDFCWSMASPRFTCRCRTTLGVPSTIPKLAFMFGTCCSARTTAKPMRCVKLTFPPRSRASWLFRIWRLISSSFAGSVRTDVAVGTPRLATMFSTMRADAPRNASGVSPSSVTGSAAPLFPGAGVGAVGAGTAGAAGAEGTATSGRGW